jgi:glycosyltransferase involved in cell wall biosynthesis
LPTYRQGGISQYVLQLIPALAAADSENEYVVLHSRKERGSYLPDVSNFRRGRLWTPCHHRLERWTLSTELIPFRLDVMHSPDFIPPLFGAKKRVITVHDLNFLYYPEFLTKESRRYYTGQIAWAVREADHISADSHATRHDLIEQLSVPPDKVTTIHLAANTVYTEDYAEACIDKTLEQYNLSPGYILFVGTLEPRKNLPTLIRAYHALRASEGYDGPLVLVGGSGWIFDEVADTIEALDLGGTVRHLQTVTDEQLAHLYSAASLLALPAFYEGFGLPALEAMHCGCPVIVSNRASLPEVVGDAGLLLNPESVDEWAEAMARVLTDGELRQKMISKGRAQAQRFSWEQTARATLQLYQQVWS